MNTKTITSFILLLLICFAGGEAVAQKKKKPGAASGDVAMYQGIYQKALKYGDVDMAKTSLYILNEIDNSGPSYRDSLLGLYFAVGAFNNAVLLGRELNEETPNNENTISILAISEQNLGLGKEALEHYDQLYKMNKKPYNLYQIANIQFGMERYGECKRSLETLLASKEADAEKIYINYSQNQGQEVPLKAAALNIQGFVAMKEKALEPAKAAFKKALELFPEFQLAKNNLEQLNKTGLPKEGQTPGQK